MMVALHQVEQDEVSALRWVVLDQLPEILSISMADYCGISNTQNLVSILNKHTLK